jgi:hypothetical protein
MRRGILQTILLILLISVYYKNGNICYYFVVVYFALGQRQCVNLLFQNITTLDIR